MASKYPDPFLEIRVEDVALRPPHAALCAGYEGGSWRCAQLADHLFQWLPFAALNQEHQLAFGASNFVELLKLAAAHIYNTKKTVSRGEIGELLLHLICILHYDTVPVLCKLILKTSSNDTVKGFDGVHVVSKGAEFELWLGESKFYIDGREAIREAVKSIKEHILPSFLNTEKAMVFGHIGPGIPHREEIIKLFKAQTSADELLKKAAFPVLIAYESQSVAAFNALCSEYVEQLRSEVEGLKALFSAQAAGVVLRFRLIFVPLGRKMDVVERFDKKLEAFL